MKDYWKEPGGQKLNKKRILITVLATIIIIAIGIFIVIYVKNREFREWVDTNILQKEVNQDKLATIEILQDENLNAYAFGQYIGILNKNEFHIYGNTAKEETKITIDISTPIFNANGRNLVIAEDKGQKIYFIQDKDLIWEDNVEGNISKIYTGQNGYTAVAITGTVNKTVISVYDDKGKSLFKTFLSTTRVSDIAISNDNKYLALAEIDTSGLAIQSKIEVFSIEKAQVDADNSKIAVYQIDDNELISNIQYHNKDKLICMSKDKITAFSLEGNKDILYTNSNKKVIFQAINLNNSVVILEEAAANLFTADTNVTIINTENKGTTNYTAKAVTKELYTYENMIALNLGTEIEFINTGGWLVKRYKAEQEITDIVLSGNIAGIIYRDKIEIVNL